MPSPKQYAANRRNSEHCTGPKTDDGKKKTRMNAKRDGITGQAISLSEEEIPLFDAFKRNLRTSLNPETPFEEITADAIAWDTWRLNHLRSVEMNMYTLGQTTANVNAVCDIPQLQAPLNDAVTFSEKSHKFALLSLYAQRINSLIQKNLAVLRTVQAERKQLREQDLADEVLIAQANDSKGLPYEALPVPCKNGSVFSTSVVKAAANRKTLLADAQTTLLHAKRRVQFPDAWANQKPIKPNSGLRDILAA